MTRLLLLLALLGSLPPLSASLLAGEVPSIPAGFRRECRMDLALNFGDHLYGLQEYVLVWSADNRVATRETYIHFGNHPHVLFWQLDARHDFNFLGSQVYLGPTFLSYEGSGWVALLVFAASLAGLGYILRRPLQRALPLQRWRGLLRSQRKEA